MSYLSKINFISYSDIKTFIPLEYEGNENKKIAKIIQNHLNSNELIVVDHPMDHPDSGNIAIFYHHLGTFKFKVIKYYDSSPEEAFKTWSLDKVEVIADKSFPSLFILRYRIPHCVRRTFDTLFESMGGFNAIPTISGVLNNNPLPKRMGKPILKGWMKKNGRVIPFVALKVICSNPKEELEKFILEKFFFKSLEKITKTKLGKEYLKRLEDKLRFEQEIQTQVKELEQLKHQKEELETLINTPIKNKLESFELIANKRFFASLKKDMEKEEKNLEEKIEDIKKSKKENDQFLTELLEKIKNKKEVKNLLGFTEATTIVLYPKYSHLLVWNQLREDGEPIVYPEFFNHNFTYFEDGSGPTSCTEEGFSLLQELIKNGSGKDLNGVNWKLCRENQKPSNSM